ncbi:hypothetical protein [Streptococcus caballi]|uniref:hypothetical protein n=1 Tax=Streptococcus caballi TaxID=439220 RepID=UPI0003659CE1|nr:hypothetical protein [Streptococcus caballi]
MYQHIEEMISQMTGSEIIRFKNKIGLYYFMFVFVMLGLYVYFATLEIPFLYWLALLVIPISFVFFLPILSCIDRGYKKILSDHLDLDRYQEIIEKNSFYQSGRIGSKNKGEKSFYYINIAYLQFLRGNFSQSLEALSQFNVTDFKSYKQQNIVFYYYLELLNKILLGEPYDLQFYLDKMSSQIFKVEKQKIIVQHQLNTARALDKIITHHEPCDYFETSYAGSKIDKVLEMYYAGLNRYNQGMYKKALEFFSAIASENQALFVVQKARKYLEES